MKEHLVLVLLLSLHLLNSSLLLKKTKKHQRKLIEKESEELNDHNNSVDVREVLHEKDKDNPLSELWDANNMKITRQSVDMNMNVPLNRLKLVLSDKYRVKLVVHNDEDFDQLYEYFHPKNLLKKK